jgi:hypothetical protein
MVRRRLSIDKFFSGKMILGIAMRAIIICMFWVAADSATGFVRRRRDEYSSVEVSEFFYEVYIVVLVADVDISGFGYLFASMFKDVT